MLEAAGAGAIGAGVAIGAPGAIVEDPISAMGDIGAIGAIVTGAIGAGVGAGAGVATGALPPDTLPHSAAKPAMARKRKVSVFIFLT